MTISTPTYSNFYQIPSRLSHPHPTTLITCNLHLVIVSSWPPNLWFPQTARTHFATSLMLPWPTLYLLQHTRSHLPPIPSWFPSHSPIWTPPHTPYLSAHTLYHVNHTFIHHPWQTPPIGIVSGEDKTNTHTQLTTSLTTFIGNGSNVNKPPHTNIPLTYMASEFLL